MVPQSKKKAEGDLRVSTLTPQVWPKCRILSLVLQAALRVVNAAVAPEGEMWSKGFPATPRLVLEMLEQSERPRQTAEMLRSNVYLEMEGLWS